MNAANILKLLRHARADGADEKWLRLMSVWFVELLLERRLVNPRRRQTFEMARHVTKLRAGGLSINELRDRTGLSRARLYQLFELSSDSLDVSQLWSTNEEILAEETKPNG